MITYWLRPGMRRAPRTGVAYAVEEIYVDGELVGSMHVSNGSRFGEVTESDGTTYPHGDSVLNFSVSRNTMVGMIMRHRAVGDHAAWRTLAADIPRDEARQA